MSGRECGSGVNALAEGGGGGVTDGWIGPENGTMAWANSVTVANLAAGFFSSARSIASWSSGGTSSRKYLSGGTGSATIDAAAAVVLPSKGVRPARSS